jgi:hypothetical protein
VLSGQAGDNLTIGTCLSMEMKIATAVMHGLRHGSFPDAILGDAAMPGWK